MIFKNRHIFLIFTLLVPFCGTVCKAQTPFDEFKVLFTIPKYYIADYTDSAPVIDGDISEAVWQSAEWSDYFVDIEGYNHPKPYHQTRMKMMWNDTFLFIAAKLEDTHVWATLKKQDAIIYYDNDFEVFIDPDNNTHQYFEIEVNAFNTIFDLFMPKPYRNGSRALISWDISKLRSAIKIQGTLNNPSDFDSSWTVEMAIPLRAITMGSRFYPPDNGTFWRINFSRVQWETKTKGGKYVKKKNKNGNPISEYNWVWSPQGVINMHYPERWGYLIFNRNNKMTDGFKLPLAEKQKRYLWLVYYKQQKYFGMNGKYAHSLGALSLLKQKQILIDGKTFILDIQAMDYQFTVIIRKPGKAAGYTINQEGLIQKITL